MEACDLEVVVKEIKQTVRDSMNYAEDIKGEDIFEIITRAVFDKARVRYIGAVDKNNIIKAVYNSICGLDVLQPLIDDEEITEIMINGPEAIFIEKDGRLSQIDVSFDTKEKLEDVIQAIVSKVNRSVNESNPIADARLNNGSRVSVVLPPVALNGPILTIRKFPSSPMTMEKLVEDNSLSYEAAKVLEKMVKAKYNIFICGGTGSGKTTFLNALSNFIPKDERIITIEDSAELQIQGIENLVRLEVRNANTEGKGEITIRDLIKTSLRMRPERIVVGEVRGAEALDMLQAMNTGHDGSLSTGHANSPKDMLSRLETMVLCGAVLPIEAIRQQIASGIDIIIHLARLRDKSRRVVEIAEVVGCRDGEIELSTLYSFEDKGETGEKKVYGSLERTANPMKNILKFKMAGVSEKV
ncbi:MAG: CpaF family protein [Deltaproteobacteria bacterium]